MYKLSCEAAMKVRGDDHLEGVSFIVTLFKVNLPCFRGLFGNSYFLETVYRTPATLGRRGPIRSIPI